MCVNILNSSLHARGSGIIAVMPCWLSLKSPTAAGRKFVAVGISLLNTVQTPFPRRLLHQVLRPEHNSSIILFRWINSSASQAMYNALVSAPRPPQDGVAKCDETLILVM